jgi:hypothetical protein
MICIDKSNGSIIRIITKDAPYNFSGIMGLAFDGVNIWVTNSDGNSVTAFNASNGSFLMHLNSSVYGFSNPDEITFDNVNRNMWVVNSSNNSACCFKSADGSYIQNIISESDLNRPKKICCAKNMLWIAYNDNTVFGYDTLDGDGISLESTLMDPLYKFDDCQDIIFDGTNMWVWNIGSATSLTGFNASNGNFFMNLKFGTISAISTCGSNICVCSMEKIEIFNPKDGTVINTITEGIEDRYFASIVGDEDNVWASSNYKMICVRIK